MLITCSFFNLDLFKAIFGPLLGTSTALLVYYLTTRRDRKKENKEKEEESNNRAKYISNLIEDSIESSSKQLKSLESHVEATRNDKMQFHPLTQFINSNLSRLIKVLNEESSFVIITKLNINHKTDSSVKIFNNLVAKVDFLDALINNVMGMAKDQFNYHINSVNSIQVATDGMLTNASITMIELQKSEMNDTERNFISAMEQIDRTLKQQPNQDIQTYYNFLVVPVNDIIGSFMTNSFRKLDNLQEIMKSTEESGRLYSQLNGTAIMYATNVEDICLEFKKAIGSLVEISDLVKTSIKIGSQHS